MALANLSPKGFGTKAMAALSFFAPGNLTRSLVMPVFENEILDATETPGISLISEISFEPNSWELTEKARESLNRLIRDIHGYRRIDGIKILSWSDIDSPAAARRKLTKRDFELAEKRSAIAREFLLATLGPSAADAYNMATTKPALDDLFKCKDTRIKRAVELAGITMNGRKISYSQKAAKTIVIVALSEELRIPGSTDPVAS